MKAGQAEPLKTKDGGQGKEASEACVKPPSPRGGLKGLQEAALFIFILFSAGGL